MAQPPRVKAKTKVRTAKLNIEPKPWKRRGRTRNKSPTKLSEIVTSKKTVPLLPRPKLLPQRKRQARIGNEVRAKTFSRSPAIIATR